MVLSDPKMASLLVGCGKGRSGSTGLVGARGAVWASVAADLLDAVVFGLAFGRGDVGGKAAGMTIGGALVFAFLGMDVLWLLK